MLPQQAQRTKQIRHQDFHRTPTIPRSVIQFTKVSFNEKRSGREFRLAPTSCLPESGQAARSLFQIHNRYLLTLNDVERALSANREQSSGRKFPDRQMRRQIDRDGNANVVSAR